MLQFRSENEGGKRKKQFTKLLIMIISIITLCTSLISYGYAQKLSPQKEQEVTQKIQDILSRKEFTQQNNRPNLIDEMAKNIWNIIKKVLRDIMPTSNETTEMGKELSPFASMILKIVGITILASFIAVLLYYVFKNFRFSKSFKEMDDAKLLSVLKDAERVYQNALELAQKGDYRQGIRFLYISLLIRLNEMNVIKIDKSKTNKQYLREAYESNFLDYELLLQFTYAFNEYWYGKRSIDKDIFDLWDQNYSSIIREVN